MNQEAAMIYLRKGKPPSHHPNECQRKRSLGQLIKSAAVVLLIGALAALMVWYVGYLIYEAVQ